MSIIQPTRRGFLLGLLAAPVIVKVSSLMTIKPIADAPMITAVDVAVGPDITRVFFYDGRVWTVTASYPAVEIKGLTFGDAWAEASRLAA